MDKCGFVGATFKQNNHLPSTVSSNRRFTLASFCSNKFNEILFRGSARSKLPSNDNALSNDLNLQPLFTLIIQVDHNGQFDQNQFLVIVFTFFLKLDACNFLNLLHCLNLTMILIHCSLFVLPRSIKFYQGNSVSIIGIMKLHTVYKLYNLPLVAQF